jgi:diguanylate cyclase (GGDEF)-like protein/PAS domain S-box-containing protein
VLERLAAGAPLEEVLTLLVAATEEVEPGMLCSVLLLDKEGKRLRHGAAPRLPDFYNQAIDGLEIGPGVGSCGNAAHTGQRTIVEDVMTHAYWVKFRKLAKKAKLRACWSQPILSAAGEVLGTLAIYYRDPRTPDQSDLDLIGTAAHLAGIAVERKRAEEARRESDERYRTLYEKTPVMVHSIDRDARLISVSDYWLEILGYERDEVLGHSIVEFYTAEARQYAEEIELPHFFKTGASNDVPLQIVKKNGDIMDILLSATAQYDQEGEFDHSLAVMIDVTERKRAEAHIEHLALHDSLTNLPNRFLFHDRLQNAVAQVERTDSALALLFLDLDDFKDVNDTLGHAAGDELLKAVAERLKSYLRNSDTVGRHNTTLARLGGDEFTILLTNLSDPVDAATVADRIIEDLSRPFAVGDNVIHTGACIGIAVYPSHGGTPEELLKKADLALYRCKAEGRNKYHFYSEQMETEILARKDLERDLRGALAEGQLSLVYQPQMDIKSGAMVGMEALLRWNHPERGFISPVEFIPVAEAIGLIVPIGEWVLRQACAQNKAWQEAGLPAFAVAVNLSAVQFRQEDLVATVHDALQQAGLDPAYLHIEITESVFMQDGAREILLDFRRSGIDISLDDFGTGYSSLSYLTRFPVDKIKLDRSFVRDIAHDTSNAAIIKAVVNLGHSLGMRVNVEGVETGDVVSILSAYGVDEVQGFYYSHPLPADGVAGFLTEIAAPSNRVATRA